MAKRRNSWITLGLQSARLGVDAWSVVGLRLARLAQGGPVAALECQRMIGEKSLALAEAQWEVAMAIATGKSSGAARKALASYHRRVRANHRRLTRKD
jgi:hypothetical protein